MANLRSRAARRLVLDLGSSAIRLCELSQTKSGYQLSKYYQREMLIDPSIDDAAKREIRLNALRELLKEAKVRTKKAIFGVPGQSVFTRTRALPPVPEHKVTQIVRYEIQQQIPFALDQIALDYQVLGRTEAGGYEVLMAAIKVDVVDRHLDLLQEAKRTADLVDVAPLAAYNWLKHTGEFGDQGECVALLDIGAATTDIVIERDNQFRFTRSLNIGGNDITSAVARNFNVGFAEAEQLKRERGFAPTGDPQRDGKGGEVIGQVLGRLVNEIARSFAYFRSQPGGGPVSRVILAGGTASLRNIVPYLQRQLGLDVRIAQPLAGLAVSANAQEANERPEQASVALGLALRSIQGVPIEINLIPPRIIESARRKEQAFYWALSIVTLALIMASTVPMQAKRTDAINQQIDRVKMMLVKYDPALALDPTKPVEAEKRADEREKQQQDLQSQIDTLNSARERRHFWLDFLKTINDARPPGQGVWFSSVQTTLIGGPQNSGVAGAAPAPVAPPPVAAAFEGFGNRPASAAGAATPAPADGAAAPAGDSNPNERGGLGRLSQLAASGSAAPARSAAAQGAEASSTGFPGLQANLVKVASAGGGMRSGGGLEALGGGSRGGSSAENAKSMPPPTPNGLIINGFAETPEAVAEFVKRLKESDKFIADGVYLDESATNNVPMTTLYNAPVESVGGGAARVAGGSSRSSSRREDREGGAFGNQSSYSATPSATDPALQGPVVTAFRIDVQFAGKPVKLQEAQSLSSGPAQPGGQGGFGNESRRGRGRDE